MTKQLPASPVHRALDLGFGFTKFSTAGFADEVLKVAAFPSYAGPAMDKVIGGVGGFSNPNVLTIAVGDERFSVGEDSRRAADGNGRQFLEATFFRSKQYLALAKGALAFMDIPDHGNVDSLVMGLPLNIFGDQALTEHIKSSLTGMHSVPDIRSDQRPQRQINVKNTQIIPQVVGSLFSMSREVGLAQQIHEQHNLTIDAGYGTLLWLVTEGFAALPTRSGGNMGGVSSLLQKVVRSIDPGSVHNITLLDKIDKALLNGAESFNMHGKKVETATVKGLLTSAAQENLTELIRSIGNTADIDNIFLTGGGAHLYKEAIVAAFPGRTINTSEHGSRYTNVRGFQILAEMTN